MKVYVVTRDYSESEYKIEGAFSTKEKAEAFALLLSNVNDIEEFGIDERVEDVFGPVWGASILLKGGEVTRDPTRDPYACESRLRNPRFTETSLDPIGRRQVIIIVESAVSAEHALKVAAETRQNMLREAALTSEQSVDPA